MKKTLSVLIVLCVATALFAAAGVTVKAGGSFGFTSMSVYIKQGGMDYQDSVKANGFGFDAGIQISTRDRMFAFGEFSMLFPAKETYRRGTTEQVHKVDSVNKLFYTSFAAGVGYRLSLDIPLKISVGGGLFVNKQTRKYTNTVGKFTDSFASTGIAGMLEAKYMFTEEFGAALTLLPQIGILNWEIERKEGYSEFTCIRGLGAGFSMPIVLGVAYSFNELSNQVQH